MFYTTLLLRAHYIFFDFEEAAKDLLLWSLMLNLCLFAALAVGRRKKIKEEKAAKEKETAEQERLK